MNYAFQLEMLIKNILKRLISMFFIRNILICVSFISFSAYSLEIDEDKRYIVSYKEIEEGRGYEHITRNSDVLGSQDTYDLGFPVGNSIYSLSEIADLAKDSVRNIDEVFREHSVYKFGDSWTIFLKHLLDQEINGLSFRVSNFENEKLKRQYKDEFLKTLVNAKDVLYKLYNLGDFKLKNVILNDAVSIDYIYDFSTQKIRLDLPFLYRDLKVCLNERAIRFSLPFDIASQIVEKANPVAVSYDIELKQNQEVPIDVILNSDGGCVSSYYDITSIEISFLSDKFLAKRWNFINCYNDDCKGLYNEMMQSKKEIFRLKLDEWEYCRGHYRDECS